MKQTLIEMKGISKNFGSIQALNNVDFKVFRGEVVGLVGDNGAGKSTLLRILCGMYAPTKTKHEIYFEGKKMRSLSPKITGEFGIQIVHQGFGLVDHMNITRNLFLGKEPCKKIWCFKILDLKKMRKLSKEMLRMIGLITAIGPDSIVGDLSGGERQSVKVGRSFFFKPKLIILDEPTIGLSVRETAKVIGFLKKVKKEGVAIIFVTHDIHQVYEIADRIVILERGTKIADFPKEEKTVEEIIEIIRGK